MSEEKTLTDEEIDIIVKKFVPKHSKNDMIIQYCEDIICVLDCKEKQYLKIDSSRNSLNKYLKMKGWDNEKLIQKLKNSLTIKRKSYIEREKKKITTDKLKPDKSIKEFDDLKKIILKEIDGRYEEFEMCLYVILSKFFHDNDSIYLGLISPKGTGKSTVCKCFPPSRYIYQIDDLTTEAFAPGTTREDDISHSLLDEIKEKTMITHDLSAILSSNEEKVNRFFNILTNAYGDDSYKKFSPGMGLGIFGNWFNFIFGMTPELYYRNSWQFHNSGRCLFLQFKEIDQLDLIEKGYVPPDNDKIQKAVLGFIEILKKNIEIDKPKDKIKISLKLRKYLRNFFEIHQYYKLIWKNKNKDTGDYVGEYKYHKNYGKEGVLRPHNQMMMLCKTKAYLDMRDEITIEDIKYFKKIFYGLDDEFIRAEKLKVLLNIEYKGAKLFDNEIFNMFDTRKDLIGEKERKKKEVIEEVTEEELKELEF